MMREGDVVSGAALLIDSPRGDTAVAELKTTPAVAGAGFKRAVLRNFREMLAANMNLSIFINVIFAGIIAFGVVYNAARVSLSETQPRAGQPARARLHSRGDLADPDGRARAADPGGAAGRRAARATVWRRRSCRLLDSEVYRFPLIVSRAGVSRGRSSAIIAATLISGLVVRRRLDRLDLVAVLKIRE